MSITNASFASQNQLHTRQADAPELNIEYEVNPFPYSFPTGRAAGSKAPPPFHYVSHETWPGKGGKLFPAEGLLGLFFPTGL